MSLARRAWLGLGLAAAVGLVAWSFDGFLGQIDQVEAPPGRHADGAVALTGGADRISDAIELLARGDADRLLITGVNPLTSRAGLLRTMPQARRLFGCCIDLGYEAANTIGNASETERWVRTNHIRSLIVVTSNYHMPRALAEIGSALPDVDLRAYPVVTERDRSRPWWSDAGGARLILSEYVKYVASQLRLRLAPPRPEPRQEVTAR